MLRWFPRFQVATTCFSCSPPVLNLVLTIFISVLTICIFADMQSKHCYRVITQLQLINIINIIIIIIIKLCLDCESALFFSYVYLIHNGDALSKNILVWMS